MLGLASAGHQADYPSREGRAKKRAIILVLVTIVLLVTGCMASISGQAMPWHLTTAVLNRATEGNVSSTDPHWSERKLRLVQAAKVVKTFGQSLVSETLDEFRYPKIRH